MSEPIRICFLADRHDLYDDRIYWKMAVPLQERGFLVHYLLIGNKNESGITDEGIHFKSFKLITFSQNRSLNFVIKRLNPNNNYKKMFREAKALKADIYHFHDLWLNRIAVKLKRLYHSPIVFYDAREPYAEDYLSYVKTSFPWFLRMFAHLVDRWEKGRSRHYDMVIANEPLVRQRFSDVIGEERTEVLYNYTNLASDFKALPDEQKLYDLIYCGAITELRGAFEMLRAIQLISLEVPSVKALLLGNYYPASLKKSLSRYIIENNLLDHVILKDAVPYKEVAEYYNLSRIGLVLLQRVKTFEISMPIKIFEYLGFGLPVVGSNFGHIRDYIERDQCGIAVAPNDPVAISQAVVSILRDKEIYDSYSRNGIKASNEKYSWDREFEKLIRHYTNCLNER